MKGMLRRFWQAIRTPSPRFALGTLLSLGLVTGALGWIGFDAVVAHTSTLEFCTSCHEMEAFVYQEYKQTRHYENHSGVRAVCADCHVPRALAPKLWRKFQATYNEVPKHLLGTIDNAEKFEARRGILAQHVWDTMKSNDSRECRECHKQTSMLLAAQKPRARGQHEAAITSGETCIDCHKGIAHKLPEGYTAEAAAPAETTAAGEDDFAL